MWTNIPCILYHLLFCPLLSAPPEYLTSSQDCHSRISVYTGNSMQSATRPKTDTLPEFSYPNIRQYIFSNFHYPQEAIKKGIEGEVQVSFCVDTNGHIDNIQITRTVHPVLDSIATAIFRKMPRWQPILKQGKPERIFYTVPVIFEIPKSNQKSQKAKS